jgi:hypothetical protein
MIKVKLFREVRCNCTVIKIDVVTIKDFRNLLGKVRVLLSAPDIQPKIIVVDGKLIKQGRENHYGPFCVKTHVKRGDYAAVANEIIKSLAENDFKVETEESLLGELV